MKQNNTSKEWTKFLKKEVGGKAKITKFKDVGGKYAIDIFSSHIADGYFLATVGLHEIALYEDVYAELIAEVEHQYDYIDNILSTAGFYIMKNGWKVKPGDVIQNMVSLYDKKNPLKHLYFTSPMQLKTLSKVELSEKIISPILLIPISEKEREYINNAGVIDFESRLEKEHVSVFNWRRKSLV